MKRLLAALLALCLLPACALALDLADYALPQIDRPNAFVGDPLPASADRFYWIHQRTQASGKTGESEIIRHLQRYDGGEQTLNLRLPAIHNAYFTPILREDGSVLVAMGIRLASSEDSWKEFYTIYDLDGQALARPRSLDGNPYTLRFIGDRFVGVGDYAGGQSLLLLYDEDMALAQQFTLPIEDAHIQALVRSGGALYLLAIPRDMDSFVLIRIGDDGGIWAQQENIADYRFRSLFADGQGGVLLAGPLAADYKQSRIRRINASGAALWEQTLSAQGAIVSLHSGAENPGGTATLYGSVVAKSRGLFTLFAMTLDRQDSIQRIDAWDIASTQDSAARILRAADGTLLAYAPGHERTPRVLLPLSALPPAKNTGLWLE